MSIHRLPNAGTHVTLRTTGTTDAPTYNANDPAYYGLVGEVVAAVAPHSEADPLGLAVDFLVTFGNAVNSAPFVRVGAGGEHRAHENIILVGSTSRARKGTAHADVRPIFLAADEDHARKCVRNGIGSGEGLVGALDDNADPQRDRRLLVFEPELARLLAVASREGSTLSSVMREAWDGNRLEVIVKKTKECIAASKVHVSVIAHTTESELRKRLPSLEVTNGFANRFLVFAVQRSRLIARASATTATFYAELGRTTGKRLQDARKVSEMTWAEDAGALWDFLYGVIAKHEPPGLLGAFTARYEAHLLRLVQHYALTDASKVLRVEHVEAAWSLLCHADDASRALFGSSTGNATADQILTAALDAGDRGVTTTQQSALFSGNVRAADLQLARDLLDELELAETTTEPTGGRPRSVTKAKTAATADAEPWSLRALRTAHADDDPRPEA